MNTPRHTLLQLRNVMHDVTLPEWWVAILQSANFSIITTDENGLILSFNPAAERMLGYHAEEVAGRHTPALFHDPQEVAERVRLVAMDLGPSFVKLGQIASTRPDVIPQDWIVRRP